MVFMDDILDTNAVLSLVMNGLCCTWQLSADDEDEADWLVGRCCQNICENRCHLARWQHNSHSNSNRELWDQMLPSFQSYNSSGSSSSHRDCHGHCDRESTSVEPTNSEHVGRGPFELVNEYGQQQWTTCANASAASTTTTTTTTTTTNTFTTNGTNGVHLTHESWPVTSTHPVVPRTTYHPLRKPFVRPQRQATGVPDCCTTNNNSHNNEQKHHDCMLSLLNDDDGLVTDLTATSNLIASCGPSMEVIREKAATRHWRILTLSENLMVCLVNENFADMGAVDDIVNQEEYGFLEEIPLQ